eukprot:801092-Pyramimonas_sp.AAC.2
MGVQDTAGHTGESGALPAATVGGQGPCPSLGVPDLCGQAAHQPDPILGPREGEWSAGGSTHCDSHPPYLLLGPREQEWPAGGSTHCDLHPTYLPRDPREQEWPAGGSTHGNTHPPYLPHGPPE